GGHRSLHETLRVVAGQLEIAVEELMTEIQTTGVAARPQKVLRPLIDVATDARDHCADRAGALSKIALRAPDEIVRRGLDRAIARRALSLGHCVEHADRYA